MVNKSWVTYRVAELTSNGYLVVGDGYRAKNSELGANGLPFIRAGNINQGFQFDDVDYLVYENVPKAKEKVSQVGDVVFTSKGTVGRFALVRDDTPKFVYSPQLCYWRICNLQLIEPLFLFYWMQS